ncbi:response regulator [Treponema sp.]|uniref:response regulator n=1 Tax=Treponema sp. TaxID=166 RepID=UPI00388D05A7
MAQNEKKSVMYSALEVAEICGVVNQTAINWIKKNSLKAFKTPGGQFRVSPDDLAHFMKERNMEIPVSVLSECEDSRFLPRSLLIVDDDRGLNSVVAKYLSKNFSDIEVYQAFDGFEAGSLMTEKHPGCIILDLDLPGIDGFDLCRRINETEKFGKPVIIVVTALETENLEEKVASYGVNNFMRKPLDLVSLVNMIKSIFE